MDELTKLPVTVKQSEKAHFMVPKKNSVLMADIIFMPDDEDTKRKSTDSFKYITILIDLATSNLVKTPLKYRDAKTALQAFKVIMREAKHLDKKLSYSLFITDGGSEFKGVFHDYIASKGIIHKTTERGRHQQMKPIDSRIALISRYLHIIMLSEELENKQVNKKWTKYLKTMVSILNRKRYLKRELTDEDMENMKKIVTNYNKKKTDHEDIIPIGTKVRYKLDVPINPVTDKQFSNEKFRKGDVRFSKQIHKIETLVLNPNQPVMYKLNGINHVRYIKQQLLIAK